MAGRWETEQLDIPLVAATQRVILPADPARVAFVLCYQDTDTRVGIRTDMVTATKGILINASLPTRDFLYSVHGDACKSQWYGFATLAGSLGCFCVRYVP